MKRVPLILLGALVVAAIAGIALFLASSGPDEGAASSGAPIADPAPAPTPAPSGGGSKATGSLRFPAKGNPLIGVLPDKRIEVHSSPGGKVVGELGAETEFGSPTVLSVQKQRGEWVGVPTPLLQNGHLGWVELDPKRLQAGAADYEIEIDLSERSAKLLHGKKVKQSWQVSVGLPETATPTGRFAVTDTFEGELSSVYGCCAVAITARQPSLPPDWPGGDRIAIHGTDGPLGVAVSNGCIRSADEDVQALIETVPLGTPVTIQN